MSGVQFVIGILLISAKQEIVKHYFLLKQLYEIGPWNVLKFQGSFPQNSNYPNQGPLLQDLGDSSPNGGMLVRDACDNNTLGSQNTQ